MTVTELRQKYRVFTYQSAHWQIEGDKFQASFVFSAGENRFQHQVMIPLTSQIGNDNQKKEGNEVVIDKSDKRLIDQVIFSLGMVELLSYWKAFCSPIVEVQAGKLADWQKHWWHDLLLNGMGEYFFVNQIDFTRENFVKIVATNQNNHGADVVNQPSDNLAPDYVDPTQPKTIELDQQSSCLIPIGGGKDSIVTLEILKQFHQQSVGYSLANNNQRVVINQQIQSDQSPATSYQKPQSSHQQLAANNQPPTTNHQQQATSYQQPTISNKLPATSNQPLTTSHQQLAANNQPPATGPLYLLLVNPTQAAREIVNQADLPTIIVDRQIDPYLLELNKQGYLNGHVPFSASLAFISTLVAYIHNIDQVVLSNEASANEANLTYLDRHINHQYSKSFEFETKFRKYVTNTARYPKLVEDLAMVRDSGFANSGPHELIDQFNPVPFSSSLFPTYFSLLRPLNELQIGRVFAKLGQPYFTSFRSCNRGSKTNIWCGDCPKCLFAYLMLAFWLDESTMITIFGQNLLANEKLLPTLQALIGLTDQKPLECVGLREESLVACYLLTKSYQKNHNQLPTLLALIQTDLEKQPDLCVRSHRLLATWNQDHFLPPSLANFLHTFF